MRYLLLFILLALILIACGGDSEDEENAILSTLTPTAEDQSAPTLDPALRETLEFQYEALRQSQEQIETVWQDLQAGQPVSCTTIVEVNVPPEAVTGMDALFRAAVEIDRAVGLWEAECQNPRPHPPPEIIDQGLRAALAAGDALRDAEAILSP